MTPEPVETRQGQATGANAWREILHSDAEAADAAGLSLEHLIDLQRARAAHMTDTR